MQLASAIPAKNSSANPSAPWSAPRLVSHGSPFADVLDAANGAKHFCAVTSLGKSWVCSRRTTGPYHSSGYPHSVEDPVRPAVASSQTLTLRSVISWLVQRSDAELDTSLIPRD
jgi:hypothetical protein